jgi:flagellar protein FliS
MTAIVEQAAQKYARLEVETGVAAASPQRLIVMLYDGAVRALLAAKAALAAGDVGARGARISKAISIIDDGLRPAVDPAAGGDIAQNLLELYDYIVNRLLLANLKSDEASLDEAITLLTELKGAWEILERQSVRGAAPQAEARAPGVAASYGKV